MDPARSVLWSIGAYLRRRAPVHAVPDFAAKKKPRASGGSYGASSALRASCFWVYAYPAFLMYAAHSAGGYWARILPQASEIAA
jgi:hypothetical protein